MRYAIQLSASIQEHLAHLTGAERARAPWELRIGPLRVFYEIDRAVVRILAVGKKTNNVLWIGGREIKL